MHEQPPAEENLDLSALARTARDLAGMAVTATPDQFSGFAVTCTDEGRAEFTMHDARVGTAYDRLSIFHGRDGVLCLEEETQRPSHEGEGFGYVVRETTTYPLTNESSTRIRRMGRLQKDGLLTVLDEHLEPSFGESMNAATRDRLVATVQDVTAARYPAQSRAAQRRGWLSWITGR